MKGFLQKNRVQISCIIEKSKKRVKESSFIKSILTLSSGAVLSQAIIFAGTPLISRLYSPSDMGEYTILSTASSVCCSVSNLGMMTSFMLPETDRESRSLCKLVAVSTVVLSFFICLILFFMQGRFRIVDESSYPYSGLMGLLWLIGVCVTINNICTAYINRLKMYKVILRSQILYAITNVTISALLGFAKGGFVGYSVGSICAYLVSIIYLILHGNPFVHETDKAFSYFKLLRSYKRFPLYSMPANIVMMLSEQVNAQIFRIAFTADILGMYSMANKILTIPALLLATPINRVFFREASERYHDGRPIGDLAFSMIRAGTIAAWLPLALIVLFGREIFAFFLGAQWGEAGIYASILGLYSLMSFIDAALNGAFIIIRMNKWNLYIGFFDLLTSLFLMMAAVFWIENIYMFLILMTGSRILRTLIFKGIFLKKTGVPFLRFAKFILLYTVLPIILIWGLRAIF